MLPKLKTCHKCRFYNQWCEKEYRNYDTTPPRFKFPFHKFEEYWFLLKLLRVLLGVFLFLFGYICLGGQWVPGILMSVIGGCWLLWWRRKFYVPDCVPQDSEYE
jgi:hypothetical protein